MRPDALVFSGETDNPYVHWFGKGMPGIEEWGLRFYSQDTTVPTASPRTSGILQAEKGPGPISRTH